jgi:hypothetical protein
MVWLLRLRLGWLAEGYILCGIWCWGCGWVGGGWLCHEGIGVSATDGCVLIVFLIYCLYVGFTPPARSFKQPYGGSLRHRLSVRFWVQFRFQINITKQVFVVLAYPLFSRSCYSAAVSFRLLYRSILSTSNSLAGRAAADDAVGRRVGVRLVCATVGFMRFVRVVVPLLLFVPYKF